MTDQSFSDPLFKGCTRPAMIFGIPVVPFAVVAGVTVLFSVWFTLFVLLSLAITIPVMRAIAKKDDQQFRLLGLKIMQCLPYYLNGNGRFWGCSTYSPTKFEKRKG